MLRQIGKKGGIGTERADDHATVNLAGSLHVETVKASGCPAGGLMWTVDRMARMNSSSIPYVPARPER